MRRSVSQKASSRPTSRPGTSQMDTIRIFDQLIYNMDRSQENLLIGKDWKAWMIDHTRAFRKWPHAAQSRCGHALQSGTVPRLAVAAGADVARELGPYLTDEEIDGMMARRDLIIDLLQARK